MMVTPLVFVQHQAQLSAWIFNSRRGTAPSSLSERRLLSFRLENEGFFNWLSLRKMQWRQMRQGKKNGARWREEEARMEARRQQAASAAVAAAAAGDVNLPSGLLAGFEFAVSVKSAKLKEFDEEEKTGEPLGYWSTIRRINDPNTPLDELPKHMAEWRADLPLLAVARWSEKSERRSLENARKAASWDAAAICEMRSKIPIGYWPRFARQ